MLLPVGSVPTTAIHTVWFWLWSMLKGQLGRAEHAAGVIAAPVVAAVWTEEHVVPPAAMLSGAGTPPAGMVLDLERDQVLKEPGKIDGQLRLPFGLR